MNNQQMGMPPATEPKKNNTTLIIVIVVLLVCCCCGLIAAVGAWGCYDWLVAGISTSCNFGLQ